MSQSKRSIEFNKLIEKLKSSYPKALDDIDHELYEKCETLKAQVDLLKHTYHEQLIQHLKTTYPDVYAEYVDGFQDDDIDIDIEILEDTIAIENLKRTPSVQQPQLQPNSTLTQTKPNMSRAKTIIPRWDDDVGTLNALRNNLRDKLINHNDFNTRNLTETLQTRDKYRELMKNIHVPKEKVQKHGVNTAAMQNLINVVAKLKQDVKQIREAQSVKSASDWIKNKGYSSIYEATTRDLDDDGIDEIVVQTKSGKQPVIVNGYTTVDSKFPYRSMYYDAYPTKLERESAKNEGITGVREYINRLYNPVYDQTGRKITGFGNENVATIEKGIKDGGYKVLIRPKDRSTFQAFVARCVTPIFRGIQYIAGTKNISFKVQNQQTGEVKNIKLTVAGLASHIWNQCILLPAMRSVYGDDVMNIQNDDDWKNLRNQKDVKNAVDILVTDYLTNSDKVVDDLIIPALQSLNHYFNAGIEQNQIILFKAATDLILNNQKLPLRSNFDPGEFLKWYTDSFLPMKSEAKTFAQADQE